MKQISTLGPLVLIAAVTVGCASVPAPLPPEPAAGDYRIQPDDSMEFLYYTDRQVEETRLRITVQPDGRILVPFVGSIVAAGRTPSELLEIINDRLEKKFTTGKPTPHFSVNVFPSRTVQVLGMVLRPGRFDLKHGMRATDALAMAGDFRRPLAAPNSSVLVRRKVNGGEIQHPIYFDQIIETGVPLTNWVLEPGDLIYVPPTPFRRAAFFLEDILSPVGALLSPVTGAASFIFTGV
jgi:polysaccharide export outer membrane protein